MMMVMMMVIMMMMMVMVMMMMIIIMMMIYALCISPYSIDAVAEALVRSLRRILTLAEAQPHCRTNVESSCPRRLDTLI